MEKQKKMRKYQGEYIIDNQHSFSFKRELIFEEKNVYPTGFGIPESVIKEVDLSKKINFFKEQPPCMHFLKPSDLGGSKNHHIFENKKDYFEDISTSWFGVTSKKGGWDTLRHYEIISAGTLLLFRITIKNRHYALPKTCPVILTQQKKNFCR